MVGFMERYDDSLQGLAEGTSASGASMIEDSLRYYALRLHELGMIKSSPKQIIAEGTDWRFLNELKAWVRSPENGGSWLISALQSLAGVRLKPAIRAQFRPLLAEERTCHMQVLIGRS
jgi:hypothetical protein